MTTLLCEFKQGNKILAKIYHREKYKYPYIVEMRGCSAEYTNLVDAIDNTHDYIDGLLSIKKNRKYTMLHYDRISQYIQIYKLVFDNTGLIQDRKLYKTIVA